jgi:protein NrfD
MLPLLFLVSASSTGIMAVLLLAPSADRSLLLLSKVDLVLLVLEGLLIAFYLQASHRTGEARASARLLLKGRLSGAFWIGLVGLGILVPVVLEIVVLAREDPAGAFGIVRIAALPGLLGGLLLRRLVLAAGVRAPLRAAGIEFPLVALR